MDARLRSVVETEDRLHPFGHIGGQLQLALATAVTDVAGLVPAELGGEGRGGLRRRRPHVDHAPRGIRRHHFDPVFAEVTLDHGEVLRIRGEALTSLGSRAEACDVARKRSARLPTDDDCQRDLGVGIDIADAPGTRKWFPLTCRECDPLVGSIGAFRHASPISGVSDEHTPRPC